jgi:hypothetical protein
MQALSGLATAAALQLQPNVISVVRMGVPFWVKIVADENEKTRNFIDIYG